MEILVARVYDPVPEDGGFRVLVDRLWPRGLSKEAARVDAWLKDIAPTTGLRKWFDHDPEKWDEFRRRYFAELDANPSEVARLVEIARKRPVVLVYGARDIEHNQALALREYVLRRTQ
jgi:uncharacterized protein YeaO (DUF488 family)